MPRVRQESEAADVDHGKVFYLSLERRRGLDGPARARSSRSVGPKAAAIGGGSSGSPRWVRIFRIDPGSVMKAMEPDVAAAHWTRNRKLLTHPGHEFRLGDPRGVGRAGLVIRIRVSHACVQVHVVVERRADAVQEGDATEPRAGCPRPRAGVTRCRGRASRPAEIGGSDGWHRVPVVWSRSRLDSGRRRQSRTGRRGRSEKPPTEGGSTAVVRAVSRDREHARFQDRIPQAFFEILFRTLLSMEADAVSGRIFRTRPSRSITAKSASALAVHSAVRGCIQEFSVLQDVPHKRIAQGQPLLDPLRGSHKQVDREGRPDRHPNGD
jgi:hypothetical protein